MRNIDKIRDKGKLWVSIEEIASILGLPLASVRVYCARAVKNGDLLRVKRGLYVLPGKLRAAGVETSFRFANQIVSPSYISLLPALSYYGISSQVPSGVYESVANSRSTRYIIEDIEFRYVRFPKKYWFGFKRVKDFFVAEPEKALADALYLSSIGKYALDVEAMDLGRTNKTTLIRYLKLFPKRTMKLFNERFKL